MIAEFGFSCYNDNVNFCIHLYVRILTEYVVVLLLYRQLPIIRNYLKSLFAIGFQGLLILLCVGIYAVLIQGITTGGDPIGAIWGAVGYTVLLCFMLFKTGTISKSIFGAH